MAAAPVVAPRAGRLRVKLFRGLADPVRLALVEALREGPRTVSELVALTQIAQPNVSKHLACLRDCGLVIVTREGRTATYRLVLTVAALLDAAKAVLPECGAVIAVCPNDGEPS